MYDYRSHKLLNPCDTVYNMNACNIVGENSLVGTLWLLYRCMRMDTAVAGCITSQDDLPITHGAYSCEWCKSQYLQKTYSIWLISIRIRAHTMCSVYLKDGHSQAQQKWSIPTNSIHINTCIYVCTRSFNKGGKSPQWQSNCQNGINGLNAAQWRND